MNALVLTLLLSQVAVQPTIGAHLVGEQLTHPGAQLSAGLDIAPPGAFTVVTEASVGGWFHPGSVLGLWTKLGAGGRLTTAGGFFVEALAEVGCVYLMAPGTVYGVTPSNEVSTIANSVRPALLFGGQLGLGWDLRRTTLEVPLRLTLRGGAFLEGGARWGVLWHPAVSLGVTVPLG